jgi:hypothetical protein
MSRCCAQCNYRYIVNMSIMDDSGSTWVTAFNDQVLLCSFVVSGLSNSDDARLSGHVSSP